MMMDAKRRACLCVGVPLNPRNSMPGAANFGTRPYEEGKRALYCNRYRILVGFHCWDCLGCARAGHLVPPTPYRSF